MALLPDAFDFRNSCFKELSFSVGAFAESLGVELAVGGAIGS